MACVNMEGTVSWTGVGDFLPCWIDGKGRGLLSFSCLLFVPVRMALKSSKVRHLATGLHSLLDIRGVFSLVNGIDIWLFSFGNTVLHGCLTRFQSKEYDACQPIYASRQLGDKTPQTQPALPDLARSERKWKKATRPVRVPRTFGLGPETE